MTTNISKLAGLRLFKQGYRESLASFAKEDACGARESLESEYEEALRVIKKMGDEDREDAQILALSQYRTLGYVIASSRDDGAAWLGAMSKIDLWHKGTTPEELEKLYKSTVVNSTAIASPRMRREVNQLIDAIFDLRERDLAADRWFRKIAKVAGELFELSLFNENTDSSTISEDMYEAEVWLESCEFDEFDETLKSFARRIFDMRNQHLWTVAELQSDKAEERAICRNWVGDILAVVEDWKDKDTSLEDVLSDLEDLLDEEEDVRRGDLIKWIIRAVESTVDCDGLDIAAQVAKRPLYLERLEFDNEGRFIQAVLKERKEADDE